VKTVVLRADQLTAAHVEAWSRLQRADAAVDSPFMRPEFTQAVGAVRDDVEVAVLEQDGEPVGFFPFQRNRWNIGKPVGGRMSDFQGLVARQGLEWNAAELVRACGLAAWDFDHLVRSQRPFEPYHFRVGDAPFVDLSRGFDVYQAERRQAGSDKVRQTLRKARKMEREVGPLRFETHTSDPQVLGRLLEWKANQYRRTRVTNVFGFDWTVRLVEQVLRDPTEAFGGMLTALYAGDQLAAVELTLRSHGVIHGWFPAYDRSFSPYSPGMILMVELARVAPSLGIRRYDLGKGMTPYKASLMSGAAPLAEGCVALNPLVKLVRRGWDGTRSWIRSSPLRFPARVVGHVTRPLRGWLAFR
jgi:CelD/BcsL family acetyltransferase involved in cellulose biosynthesis